MQICVYGASSNDIDARYLEAGEALGMEMARRGHGLVFGGGASGLMGAVARGMTQGGGAILGVAPSFFNVDGILYDKCTEFIYTDTMRHSWGCAVDINALYNCECRMYWSAGSCTVTCGYGWWPEGTAWTAFAGSLSAPSPYSISADGSVVRAFAKYGWGWGGQGYSVQSNGSQKFDYMHFSVMPSGG